MPFTALESKFQYCRQIMQPLCGASTNFLLLRGCKIKIRGGPFPCFTRYVLPMFVTRIDRRAHSPRHSNTIKALEDTVNNKFVSGKLLSSPSQISLAGHSTTLTGVLVKSIHINHKEHKNCSSFIYLFIFINMEYIYLEICRPNAGAFSITFL